MKVQVSTRNGWSFIQTWLKVREGEIPQSLKAPKNNIHLKNAFIYRWILLCDNEFRHEVFISIISGDEKAG